VLCNDAFTTIKHLANANPGRITLVGGVDLSMTGGMVLQFIWDAAIAGWRQVRGT